MEEAVLACCARASSQHGRVAASREGGSCRPVVATALGYASRSAARSREPALPASPRACPAAGLRRGPGRVLGGGAEEGNEGDVRDVRAVGRGLGK